MLVKIKLYLVNHSHLVRWLLQYKNKRKEVKLVRKAAYDLERALPRYKDKDVYKCVFFALDRAVWKYDALFKKMMKDPRFDPIVLVCPIVNYGRESMLQKMEEAYLNYLSKGYPTIKSYDETTNKYVDVRKEIAPDIIVYTNPYKGLIDDRYYAGEYTDILSFYVHYGYNSVTKWDMLYMQPLTNIVWRYYVESPLHLSYVKEHSMNGGVNAVVTGYPGIEEFLDPNYSVKSDPWPVKDRCVKRVIWAPHHSIETGGDIHFSTFLQYAEYMIDLAERYSDKIQMAFKPHPLLKDKLIKVWGKEKTENYYKQWVNMKNTFFTDGEYIDLFLTSDAMIHDSGSFLIEYLYVRKPVMRLMNDDNMEEMLNGFAKKCFEVYYRGFSKDDIDRFINNIINNNDPLKDARDRHFNEYLQPINQKLPSENILNDIVDSIENQILYRK